MTNANPGTICAVVVTYNRKQLLLECLESLLRQTHPIDAIYLIDNASADGTPELLKEKGYIKSVLSCREAPQEEEHSVKMRSGENEGRAVKLHYVRMHENTGGAGGFYEGVKRGYERGYDWLWLMDDDVEAEDNSLKLLIDAIPELSEPVAAVTPLKLDKAGQIQKLHVGFIRKDKWKMIPLSAQEYADKREVISIDYSSFVGLLISKQAVKNSGFPDRDFFIWNDDVEYCCRLTESGKIYLNKKSRVIHKDKLAEAYGDCNSDKKGYLWKRYYGTRNFLMLYKRYRKNKFLLWPEMFYLFIRDMKNIFTRMNFKLSRTRFLCLAYTHAFFNIKGKKLRGI